jgi:predicted dehydrogenase
MGLRVAVIGVGRFGKEHARVYSNLPGVSLVGVVDRQADRANEVAGRCKTKAFSDYRELIGQVDAVSIAAPTQSHFEIAKACLEKGIHTLVEKPIARTVAETEELVRLSNGKVLQVGHIERFNPAFQAALPRIARPRLIDARREAPFRFRSADIDVVLDVMIHDLDLVLSLVPSDPVKVTAAGRPLMFSNSDMASARLEFEDGTVATLSANRAGVAQQRSFVVHNDRGSVSIDFGAKSLTVASLTDEFNQARAPDVAAPSEADLAKFPREFYRVETIPCGQGREPLEAELESFLKAVRRESPSVVPGDHALRVMRAADRIQREIRDHRWK